MEEVENKTRAQLVAELLHLQSEWTDAYVRESIALKKLERVRAEVATRLTNIRPGDIIRHKSRLYRVRTVGLDYYDRASSELYPHATVHAVNSRYQRTIAARDERIELTPEIESWGNERDPSSKAYEHLMLDYNRPGL